MTNVDQRPRILTPDGEVIELEFGAITADEAASRIPFIQSTLRELRRYEQFLGDMVAAEMRSRGQTERRSGELVFELKPETAWVVDDGGAMYAVLYQAVAKDEITENEFHEAVQQVVSHKFDHRRLNVLVKRVPEIEKHRNRIEGQAKLHIKK